MIYWSGIKFEVDKYYRFLGEPPEGAQRPFGWNSNGKMDCLLDHKPRKCICAQMETGYGIRAFFEGMPARGNIDGWLFSSDDLQLFEEVLIEEQKQSGPPGAVQYYLELEVENMEEAQAVLQKEPRFRVQYKPGHKVFYTKGRENNVRKMRQRLRR